MTIRKDCADHLRQHHAAAAGETLRSGHAHELVAAYFGYGNGAALRADETFSVENLSEADILVPDVGMVRARLQEISGLPANLGDAREVVEQLSGFLVDEGHFAGTIWNTDNLSEYVREEYLPAHQWSAIMDDLGGAMAETNASFDGPDFLESTTSVEDDQLVISVSGILEGDTDLDRPFSGDTINFTSQVRFQRIVGRVAFLNPDVETGGVVDDSYYEDAE